jgi:hypothetical protein
VEEELLAKVLSHNPHLLEQCLIVFDHLFSVDYRNSPVGLFGTTLLAPRRAFPGTEIFLSTNTGELKNIILEGNVLGNASTPTKESDDDKKGSRR